MTYETPHARRTALEARLLNQARRSDVSLDRLRRRVIFERVMSRLQAAEPGDWVLKGGMALEVRLGDSARLTKDLDLGLRAADSAAEPLRERLIEALGADPYGDCFALEVAVPKRLIEDGAGHETWRVRLVAALADKQFGGIQLDISPRVHELHDTETVQLPNSLAFADVLAPEIEIIDLPRHAAEKFHAMTKDFGERENSRVRDLVDLVILREHDLLNPKRTAIAVRNVWSERERAGPPVELPPLSEGWRERYRTQATELGLRAHSLPDAVDVVRSLWAEMFPTAER
jgi:hypothetical protein